MKNRVSLTAAAALAAVGIASTAAAAGAIGHRGTALPLRSAACSPIQNPTGGLLLTSDLPLQGADRARTAQMTRAIAFELGRHGWKAGAYTLAYQSCDDSTARAGVWDPGRCSANASHYAASASVVAVIGTLNSGCAELELPTLNRAPNGPLPMISPADTYPGLTHSAPGTAADEPGLYYPTGTRDFTRVVPAEDLEGAADALLAHDLHVTRLFVVHDQLAYGEGLAADTAEAAKKLGIAIVANVAWATHASSYGRLGLQIARSGAQAVFVGGLISENGGRLIADIRAAAPQVAIIAPDGFTPVSADVQQSGGTANGLYISVAGLPTERLPAAGQAFVKAFSNSENGTVIDPYSVYAAQAADVILAAVAASDGTRAAVASGLFKVRIPHGLLGPIAFDANGDLTTNPVTIYKVVRGEPVIYRILVPA
jgi:branched-chain amino acid transport system substrate-binding protein